ncbi:hypothetical protein GN244_ATG13727 [Phytophthora infestans]|uniref:Uncharacterized protein n=1 Tax=Phytophthora infestans TaxID=4787 RepID=A0A833VYP0_PHYIN|nr:hypothetical protein GN244_ATG13727 [Phytophthora infestans]
MRSSTASKARKLAPTEDRFIYEFAACRIRLVETSALHGCAPECIMKQFISAVTTMLGFTTGRPSEITRCGNKESCLGSKLREEKAEARPADQHEVGELPGSGEREDPGLSANVTMIEKRSPYSRSVFVEGEHKNNDVRHVSLVSPREYAVGTRRAAYSGGTVEEPVGLLNADNQEMWRSPLETKGVEGSYLVDDATDKSSACSDVGIAAAEHRCPLCNDEDKTRMLVYADPTKEPCDLLQLDLEGQSEQEIRVVGQDTNRRKRRRRDSERQVCIKRRAVCNTCHHSLESVADTNTMSKPRSRYLGARPLIVEAATMQATSLADFKLSQDDDIPEDRVPVRSSQSTITEPPSPAGSSRVDAGTSPTPSTTGSAITLSSTGTCEPWSPPPASRREVLLRRLDPSSVPSWFAEIYDSDGYDTDVLERLAPTTPPPRHRLVRPLAHQGLRS